MEDVTIRRFEKADETRTFELGDLFHIAPGHDSWVIGDEPYVSVHFLGATDYAKT